MRLKKLTIRVLILALAGILVSKSATAQNITPKDQVSERTLNEEIRAFTAREIAAHFGEIKSMNPPPERVFNALTTGDFSWGSYARTLAAEADIGGNRTIAGKNTARAVAEMGLYESRKGGKTFAQLYSAEA